MNSLGVSPFVNSLYQDLKDGLVLLQVPYGHSEGGGGGGGTIGIDKMSGSVIHF